MTAPWAPPATVEALAREWEDDAREFGGDAATHLRNLAGRLRTEAVGGNALGVLADEWDEACRSIVDGMRDHGWTQSGEQGAALFLRSAVRLRAFLARTATAQSPRTVTYDLSDPDTRHVLTEALEQYASRERDLAGNDDNPDARERWADLADAMRREAGNATEGGTSQ